MLMRTGVRGLSSQAKKTFKVLGLQQIALGNIDKSVLSSLWVDTFGIEKKSNYRAESENVDEDILSLGKGPYAVEIDLMQPINPDKAPFVHKPPLNHIGLWVDDIHKAYHELGEMGVRMAPGGIRKGASGFDVFFIHPKGNAENPLSGAGVLIEMVQAPDEVKKALL